VTTQQWQSKGQRGRAAEKIGARGYAAQYPNAPLHLAHTIETDLYSPAFVLYMLQHCTAYRFATQLMASRTWPTSMEAVLLIEPQHQTNCIPTEFVTVFLVPALVLNERNATAAG
jgi:hypothetical protein